MRVSRVADVGLASSGEAAEEFPQGQGVFFGGPRRNHLRERADIMNEQPGEGQQNPGSIAFVKLLPYQKTLPRSKPSWQNATQEHTPPPKKQRATSPGDLTAIPCRGSTPEMWV